MENLSREAILRMLSGKTGNSSSGGGGDIDLAGYATQIWVTENFVSIDFFRELFKAYDSNGNEVLPNDTETVINNIKAMFGFWTDQYLSALGQGTGGGGGGASALSDLLDVQLSNPTNGQSLVYDSSISKWVNRTVGGTDMATVWNALSVGTSEQINVSHLTNALSGYVTTSAISDMATQTWVGQQGYATQSWVTNNYLTQTAASETYLSKTDAAATYLTQTAASSTYLSIAFFDRLFQAYEGTGSSATRVNPNDTTSTIDNIKAMFGFWTEQYISALGQGAGGGGGGGDVTWTALAAATNEQINVTHLSTALSGYALTSQLSNYLPLSGGTITGGILSVRPTGGNYADGIRLHARSGDNGWAALVLCGAENTGDTGTSANTWFIGAKTGDLYFGRNSTGEGFSGSANLSCINNVWYINGSAIAVTSQIPTNNNQLTNGAGYITSSALSGYLPLSGGTLTGLLTVSSTGSNRATIHLVSAADVPNDLYFGSHGVRHWSLTSRSSSEGHYFMLYNNINYSNTLVFYNDNRAEFGSSVTASSFIKRNGTSSQFLKADGSIDSNSYALASSLNYYLPLSGGTLTGELINSVNGYCYSWGPNGRYRLGCNTDTNFYLVDEGFKVNKANVDFLIKIGETNAIKISKEGYLFSDTIFGKDISSSSSSYSWGMYQYQNRVSITSRRASDNNYLNEPFVVDLENYRVGIGTISPSYKLHVDGSIYATGGVTALSDARHKTIINPTDLQVEQIARMPAVVYRWNDGREDNGLHVGSIAQDWQRVLPEVVMRANDKEGTLSMQYGVAALVSSIITARKVVDHERRIAELERENKELKLKLKIA